MSAQLIDAALQPQQPQFPHANVQITPQGMILSIALAPGLSINQQIGEEAMNEIVKQWIETRRQIKQHLELVQHVNATRND